MQKGYLRLKSNPSTITPIAKVEIDWGTCGSIYTYNDAGPTMPTMRPTGRVGSPACASTMSLRPS
jgi:hypothetical protein